jgi:hypothetical protein
LPDLAVAVQRSHSLSDCPGIRYISMGEIFESVSQANFHDFLGDF